MEEAIQRRTPWVSQLPGFRFIIAITSTRVGGLCLPVDIDH
jgi:hypothetical protein